MITFRRTRPPRRWRLKRSDVLAIRALGLRARREPPLLSWPGLGWSGGFWLLLSAAVALRPAPQPADSIENTAAAEAWSAAVVRIEPPVETLPELDPLPELPPCLPPPAEFDVPVVWAALPPPAPPPSLSPPPEARPSAAAPPAPCAAKDVGPVAETVSNYWEAVGSAIASALRYPSAARWRGVEGGVTLRLSIGASGVVAAVEPLGPANPLLTRACLAAVRQAAPFPTPPGAVPLPATGEIPIRFQLQEAVPPGTERNENHAARRN